MKCCRFSIRVYNLQLAVNHLNHLPQSVCSLLWLFLLSRPKGEKTASGNLDNLESNTGKISLSMSRSTETSYEDLVIFINERHTTISWDVGSDSLVVFLKLNSDALSDGRIWLLSLDGDFLDDDTGSMGRLTERFLPLGSGV